MKLSVIVPVYNYEEYISSCIISIADQTVNDIEIIVIDNGSTDRSGIICDELAAKDYRIKVIHHENDGVSAARNAGIAMASGDYIGFVDADDTIRPDMYKTLLEEAATYNSDIVMCDTLTVYANGKTEPDTIEQLSSSRLIENKDWTPELLTEMAGSACRCIYKSSFLHANKVLFPEGIKFSEDRIFNLYAMGLANKIKYIKEPYYNRIVHEGSCVTRFHSDYFEQVKAVYAKEKEAIVQIWNSAAEYQQVYDIQFIDSAIAAINNCWHKSSHLSNQQRYRKVKEICDNEELIETINRCPNKDFRYSFILDKKTILLSLTAIASRIKHRKY